MRPSASRSAAREDDHIPAGYIYSQGPKGTKDPAAQLVLKEMTRLGYPRLLPELVRLASAKPAR